MKHEEGEEMCCTQCMTELIRRYTLDCAGIVFLSDRSYLRHANISNTVQKCHSTRNGCNYYINIFRNWKNVRSLEGAVPDTVYLSQ